MKCLKFSCTSLFVATAFIFTSCSPLNNDDLEEIKKDEKKDEKKAEKAIPSVIFEGIENNEETESGNELDFNLIFKDKIGLDSWRLEVNPIPYGENDKTVEERKKLFDPQVKNLKGDFNSNKESQEHVKLTIPLDTPEGSYNILAYVKNKQDVETKKTVTIQVKAFKKSVPTVRFEGISNGQKNETIPLPFDVILKDEAGLYSWRLEVDPVPYGPGDNGVISVDDRRKYFEESKVFRGELKGDKEIKKHIDFHVPTFTPSGFYDIVIYVKNMQGVETKSKVRFERACRYCNI